MTIHQRIANTAGSVFALGIDAAGFALGNGADRGGWVTAFFVLVGLAVVGVFFVNRWWALLPALTTVAAFWTATAIRFSDRPSYQEYLAPTDAAGALVVLPVLIGVVTLSLGLLVRAVWDNPVPPDPEGEGTEEAVR